MSSGDQFGRTLVKIRNLLRPLLAPWTKGNVTNAVSQYKDFALVNTAEGCNFNLRSVEALRELLRNQSLRRYKPLVALLRSALRHRVMIIEDGDAWQRTHDALSPHLSAGLVDREYTPIIIEVAQRVVASVAVARTAQSHEAGVVVDVEPLVRSITSSVLGHVMFGRVLTPEDAGYLESTLSIATKSSRSRALRGINAALWMAGRAIPFMGCPPVVFPQEQRKALDGMLGWIAAKLEQLERRQVSDEATPPLLKSLTARYSRLSPPRRRRAITAEYAMLFIAGIETTAASISFCIAEVAASQSLCERAVAEARQPEESLVCAHGLPSRYPLIHNIFREALRRHTIVPTFLRQTEAEYLVANHEDSATEGTALQVPRGATLRYLTVQGHLRRSVWPNPLQFHPDRFAKPLTIEQTKHYMPFGLGAQRCPGHAMARTEAILILVAFLRAFDIEPVEGQTAFASERNAVFTNRSVGVRVHMRRAEGGATYCTSAASRGRSPYGIAFDSAGDCHPDCLR
jgi:cytochrome P450